MGGQLFQMTEKVMVVRKTPLCLIRSEFQNRNLRLVADCGFEDQFFTPFVEQDDRAGLGVEHLGGR